MHDLTYMETLKKKSQIENKTAVTRGLGGQGMETGRSKDSELQMWDTNLESNVQ